MKYNRTAMRTVEILKFLSQRESADLETICNVMDMPKTSCYDILETLVYTGMIEIRQGQKKSYAISLGAFRLGMGYSRNFTYEKAFGELMRDLAIKLNKTCFFAVPDGNSVVYMMKKEPENPILTLGKIGCTNPMYCTSLGKAMMAFMSEEQQEELIAEMSFEPRTAYTITNAEKLRENLREIRELGYAVDYRELEDHGLCIGAPVFGENGRVMGAVSVSDLYRATENYHAVGRTVRDLAVELSRRCGYISK